MSHISAEMDKVVDEIIRNGQPTESLDAVLDLVDAITPASPVSSPRSPSSSAPASPQATPSDSKTSRSVTMALSTMASLLSAASSRKIMLSQAETKRLGSLAVRLQQDSDPEIRRADLEFCLALHERLGGENGEGFWRAVEGARESSLNLITYYLARRGKA